MSKGVGQRWALVAAALFASAGARATPADVGTPIKGEATVTALAGARWIPQGTFLDDQTNKEYRPWKTFVQPGFMLDLGYAPEPDFHITLGLGYGLDKIFMVPGTLQIKSFSILIGADAALIRKSFITVYAGGGLGYSLNTLSQNGNNVEANATAGFVRVGLRIPLFSQIALVIEERYTLASAALPGPTGPLVYAGSEGSLNVGGNLLSIGFQFHYVDSDDSKRPYHP